MSLSNPARENFRTARDELLALRADYDRAVATFRWPQVDRFNWALDWFDAELAQGSSANKTALRIVGDAAANRTFAELSRSSNSVANGLRKLGVKRGDRILLMLSNRVSLWETLLAAMKLGAITIPTTTLSTPEDVRMRVAQAGASHVVTSDDCVEKLALIPNDVVRIVTGAATPGAVAFENLLEESAAFSPDADTSADEPILLYFTSGTTARPKLVVHTHRTYGIGSLSTMYWLGLQPADVHLNVSSPGWAKHAWSCFFTPWVAGATVFIANQPRFNARALLDTLVAEKVTSICAPPTVWRMLIQEDLNRYPVALTNACAAGEPLNPEVVSVVQEAWGLTIRDGFGQTETTALIGNSPGQRVKPGSVGRPLPGYDIVLLDADGAEASEGEIAVKLARRPAGLMAGYINDSTLQRPDGAYYRTGDIASRDEDGWITYVGRADDVFKSSDYRISPFELESVLIEHPLILEAAVVPTPDPMKLTLPKAFIALVENVRPDEATALDIFRHIATALPPYKRIRRIEFATLPKTISGKIRRVELKKLEIERYASGNTADCTEFRWEDFAELKTHAHVDGRSP
ncbi:MAG TPA: AMP-binding protein [Steroidobacter sp.]|uniref:AMP-binding protein n=1 Tax=Steroidobacter sp. TaxID=1978227 RepID=UPI002ED7EB8A